MVIGRPRAVELPGLAAFVTGLVLVGAAISGELTAGEWDWMLLAGAPLLLILGAWASLLYERVVVERRAGEIFVAGKWFKPMISVESKAIRCVRVGLRQVNPFWQEGELQIVTEDESVIVVLSSAWFGPRDFLLEAGVLADFLKVPVAPSEVE